MWFRNPVLQSELRRAYRSPRVFFSRAGFSLALMVVLSLGFRHLGATQEAGRDFFYLVVLTEAALAYLTAPAFCAGALAAERRAGTLGVLLTSGLRQKDIVFGKLLGRSALVALMVLSAAPVLAASLFAGGVSPFEVIATSTLVLTGAILLSSIALYAAAAGAGFFGALLAAYLGFLLIEVGGACCIAIPGAVFSSAAGGRNFMAGSHVLSLGILSVNPQDYGEAALVATVALALGASWGLAWLGSRHLQINDLPPLPPPPPRPTKPGKDKKRKVRGALGASPLYWLEQRGTAVEFLIVPALLALYGLFVLLLLVLNEPGTLRKPGLQFGAITASGALMAALLVITGAASFARDYEDKIANQLLTTPLTGWQFLVERFLATVRKLWAFTILPFVMVLGLGLLGGPMRSSRALVVLIALAAGSVIAFAVGALFGLRQRRRGPAVSWALASAGTYWGLAPLFVSLSAMQGNVIAEWLVRVANPFRVIFDACFAEGEGLLLAHIGALVLVATAGGLTFYLGRRFGPLAGRVE